MYKKQYFNEFGEISLTNGSEFKAFPRTPRPTIILDGIFVTKKDKEEVQRMNDFNKKWNSWFSAKRQTEN